MKFEDAAAMVGQSLVPGPANWDGRTDQSAGASGDTAWSFETEHIPWSFAAQEEGDWSRRKTSISYAGPAPKRKAPQFPELFGKKQKLGGVGGASVMKNAVVTLNEYKAGLKYELLEAKGDKSVWCRLVQLSIARPHVH